MKIIRKPIDSTKFVDMIYDFSDGLKAIRTPISKDKIVRLNFTCTQDDYYRLDIDGIIEKIKSTGAIKVFLGKLNILRNKESSVVALPLESSRKKLIEQFISNFGFKEEKMKKEVAAAALGILGEVGE